MLVVYFCGPEGDLACRRFESVTLAEPALRAKLHAATLVKLSLDARVRVRGEPVVLLEHPAFAGLGRRPGVAIVDFFHTEPRLNGRVVSTLPLHKDRPYAARDFACLPDPALVGPPAAARAADSSQAVSPARKSPASVSAPPPDWFDDYLKAMDAAVRQRKMLWVYFFQPSDPRCGQFESGPLADPQIVERLTRVVKVRVPVGAKVRIQGQEVELLKHPALADMEGKPGLAILDLEHADAPYYGHVVSAFPFLDGQEYTSRELGVMLSLPAGTLTQRTLIYAVRIHPDRPASTEGVLDPVLVEEAESHAGYQAQIRVQGHHFWERRFHRINARLARGMTAREVCAESWPGQGLLAAAIECVRCWRLSHGHWGAVSARHSSYGYDMKRGDNGVWYATGIFAGL